MINLLQSLRHFIPEGALPQHPNTFLVQNKQHETKRRVAKSPVLNSVAQCATTPYFIIQKLLASKPAAGNPE